MASRLARKIGPRCAGRPRSKLTEGVGGNTRVTRATTFGSPWGALVHLLRPPQILLWSSSQQAAMAAAMAFQWSLAALETLMAEDQMDQHAAVLRAFSVVELWRLRRVCSSRNHSCCQAALRRSWRFNRSALRMWPRSRLWQPPCGRGRLSTTQQSGLLSWAERSWRRRKARWITALIFAESLKRLPSSILLLL